MPQIDFIIVVALAVGATFFVVVVAMGLIINKAIEFRQMRSKRRLYESYSSLLAGLLLQPMEGLSADASKGTFFDAYEQLLRPVKDGVSKGSLKGRGMRREAVRAVLSDFARDVTGESLERLQYFFYSLGFVDDSIAQMRDRRWWLRAEAARDLGLIRARRGTAALIDALDDDNQDVQTVAIQSLVELVGAEALGTILRSTHNLSRWASLELSVIVREFEEKSIPYLLEALSYADQSIVLFSIEMLAEIGFVSAVEPLLEMAQRYPNVVVRAKALEALGRLGDQRSESVLREGLANPYPQLRSAATRALERVGSPASVPLLLERMSSGSLDERISAARAMVKSGTRGIAELQRLALSEIPVLKDVADQVLEEAGVGVDS